MEPASPTGDDAALYAQIAPAAVLPGLKAGSARARQWPCFCYAFEVPERSDPVTTALCEYRQELDRLLPGRVGRVTLFGSRARGEAHEDSDVDVLVVLDTPAFAERSQAMDLATELGLRHELIFAPIVLSATEWAELIRRERALPREIERDGIEA